MGLLVVLIIKLWFVLIGASLLLLFSIFIFPEVSLFLFVYFLFGFNYDYFGEPLNEVSIELGPNLYFDWFHTLFDTINDWHSGFRLLLLLGILVIYVLLSTRVHIGRLYPFQLIGQALQSYVLFLFLTHPYFELELDLIWVIIILIPFAIGTYRGRARYFEKLDIFPKYVHKHKSRKKGGEVSFEELVQSANENQLTRSRLEK